MMEKKNNIIDEKKVNSEDLRQLVVFELAKEEYGIDITDVKEIIEVSSVTEVPNSVDYIKGLIDIRGEITVLVDLRKRFNVHGGNINSEKQKIIVAEIDGSLIGFLVDEVLEILKVPVSSVKKTPELIRNKIGEEYIKAVSVLENRLIVILDINKLFHEEDVKNLEEKPVVSDKSNVEKTENKNEQNDVDKNIN